MERSTVNFSDPAQRALFLTHARTLTGIWQVELKRWRNTRSNQANKFYWGQIIEPFTDWANAHGNQINETEAHSMLARKFRPLMLANAETGEVTLEGYKSTVTDSSDFSDYLEQCIAFLADFCGILVKEPNPLHGLTDSPTPGSEPGKHKGD